MQPVFPMSELRKHVAEGICKRRSKLEKRKVQTLEDDDTKTTMRKRKKADCDENKAHTLEMQVIVISNCQSPAL